MTPDGARVEVRLTPRSSADRIEGPVALADGSVVLAARVRAVPEDGRANRALLDLLAAALGVRPSDCALIVGGKSRLKSVLVTGETSMLASRLEALCGRAKG